MARKRKQREMVRDRERVDKPLGIRWYHVDK